MNAEKGVEKTDILIPILRFISYPKRTHTSLDTHGSQDGSCALRSPTLCGFW